MAEFDPESSFAVIFGVARYEDKSLFDSMDWILNNLTALKDVLTDPDIVGFNYDQKHFRMLSNPRRSDIGKELFSFRLIPHIDTFLVYYCGHGVISEGTYYLTGTDAGASAIENLSFEGFENEFLRIKAKRKILILDSCFSGRAITGKLAESNSILEANVDILEANVERLATKEEKMAAAEDFREGTYVITSADRDKPAESQDDSRQLTAFTSLFIRQLKNGFVGRNDDRVTLNDVMEVIKSQASQKGLPVPLTSDKFGLGGWRLIGNVAAIKRKKVPGETKDQVQSASHSRNQQTIINNLIVYSLAEVIYRELVWKIGRGQEVRCDQTPDQQRWLTLLFDHGLLTAKNWSNWTPFNKIQVGTNLSEIFELSPAGEYLIELRGPPIETKRQTVIL